MQGAAAMVQAFEVPSFVTGVKVKQLDFVTVRFTVACSHFALSYIFSVRISGSSILLVCIF